MANKIKCEWCGHYYDINKYESCPKCGGVNYKEELKDNLNRDNTENKKNRKKSLSHILIPLIIIVAVIGIIFFSFIYILFISLFSFINEKKENVVETSISYGNESIITEEYNDLDYDYDYDYVRNELYTDDKFIEYDDAKLYIQFISFDDFYYSNTIYPTIEIFVSDTDYDSHNIDMYLVSDETKYRITTDNTSFPSSTSVNNINDILKAKGHNSIYGKVVIGETIDCVPEMFKSILILIDDKEFNIPLRYSSYKSNSPETMEKTYPLSEKINFGKGNSLYIDNLRIETSGYFSATSVYLFAESSIVDYSNKNMEMYIEDIDGNRYKLYEDTYFSFENGVVNLNDVLKNSFSSSSLSFDVYCNKTELSNLYIYIDEEEYIVNLK